MWMICANPARCAVLLILPIELAFHLCTKSKLMFTNMYPYKNGENCAIPAMKEQLSTFVFAKLQMEFLPSHNCKV